MTKKDYELIAGAFKTWAFDFIDGKFRNITPKAVFETLVEEVAIKLKQENPRFDTHKFFKACGVERE